MIRRPPRSTLFPYTTLFRSGLRNPARCQFLELPENDLPDDLAFIEVNRGKLAPGDRKSTRLNSSHDQISYAVFCLKKKKKKKHLYLTASTHPNGLSVRKTTH